MSIVKSDTLSYFYNKIKQIFAQSVNGEKPDLETGDITIEKVPMADNLDGGEEEIFVDKYAFRTSGGATNIASGTAKIIQIEGNLLNVNGVPESLTITATNGLEPYFNDKQAWKSMVSSSQSNYTFSFINSPPNQNLAAPNCWTPVETNNMWTHNGISVNISSYGITTDAVMPSLTAIITSTGISAATVNPATFTAQKSTSGTYDFMYSADDSTWFLGNDTVTLGDYGIIITGSAGDQDKISINYITGTPNSTTISVDYTKEVIGTLYAAKPSTFVSTHFNQFNKSDASQRLDSAAINSAGEIITSAENYVCFCRVSNMSDLGYIAYTQEGTIYQVGYASAIPSIGTVIDMAKKNDADLNNSNGAWSRTIEEDGYFVVAVNSAALDDLCIHTRWDNEEDYELQAYEEPFVFTLPTHDESNTTLPIQSKGMAAVGDVRDTLIINNSTEDSYYIEKIGHKENTPTNLADVEAYGTAYVYDDNNIYYVLKEEDQTTYTINDLEPNYIVNDFGTEYFTYISGAEEVPLKVTNIYGVNLRNKLKDDVVTISPQDLKSNQQINILKNLGFKFDTNNEIITSTPVPIETYKVGDIFITTRSGDPKDLLGYGNWSRINNRFLYGVSSDAGNTGGTNGSVTLEVANLPSHSHLYYYQADKAASGDARAITTYSTAAGVKSRGTSSVGSGTAFSIMPPYYTVYMWRRTS